MLKDSKNQGGFFLDLPFLEDIMACRPMRGPAMECAGNRGAQGLVLLDVCRIIMGGESNSLPAQ